MPPRRFSPFAWGVFAYGLLVILWGYFLRISESGDGCGTDWPLCHGEVLPRSAPFATFVEFSHRISSGLVLVAVLVLAIWAFRAYPKGSAVRFAAAASLVFTITESLVGALLVVLGWVATDISLGRILIRPFHVTNTFLLMAALGLTAWWAHRGVSRLPRPDREALRRLAPALLGVLALAWTGSWTGLAATAFPAGTLQEGVGQYLDPEHLLIYLRVSHPVLALLVVWILVRLAGRLRSEAGDRATRRLSWGVAGLAVAQLLAGPLTIVLGNPVAFRLFHLLLADLLWVGLVLLASTTLEGRPGRVATPETPRPAPAR